MKNSLFLFFIFFFCNKALALPQDWPCFDIDVKQSKIITTSEDYFQYEYTGVKDEYILNINLSGYYSNPTLFANCGNSGCPGLITNIKNNKTEKLNFFCEDYSSDYLNAKCYIAFGDEFVFDKENENSFVVHYCKDNKIIHFNKSDCNKCHCLIDINDDKNNITQLEMACKIENSKAHCFTNNGYEIWRNFQNKADDFANCVKLDF